MSWSLFNFNFARQTGAQNPAGIDNDTSTGGGGGTAGGGTGNGSDLGIAIASMAPDIMSFFDEATRPPSNTVIDYGQAGYTNEVVEPLDVDWGETAILSDGGTSILLDGNDVGPRYLDVDHSDHVYVMVFDGSTLGDSDVFFNNGDIEVDVDDSSIIEINGISTGLSSATTKVVVIETSGGRMKVYGQDSNVPVYDEAFTTSGTASDCWLRGSGVKWDFFALIPADNADISEILGFIAPDVNPGYDNAVGIEPEDLTPEEASIGSSDDQYVRAQEGWAATSDGRIIFFAGGLVTKMYYSDDHGDTWTGPTDKSTEMNHTGSGSTVAGHLCFNQDENIWACIVGSQSSTACEVRYSSDNGVTWDAVSGTIYYGFGLGFAADDDLLVNFRTASSGGFARTGHIAAPGYASIGTVSTAAGAGNGGGIAVDGAGEHALSAYVSQSDILINLSGLTPSSAPESWLPIYINNNAFSASFNTSNDILLFEKVFRGDDETVDTATLVESDHTETVNPGSTAARPICIGVSQSGPSAGFIRAWGFGTATNDNEQKIHFEYNTTGEPGDWSSKAWLQTPEDITGIVSNNIVGQVYGFSDGRWMLSYTDQTNVHRLLRFTYPVATYAEQSEVEPVNTDNIVCVVNAESSSGLNVGNDAPTPIGDVFASSAANISTAQAKFGTKSLYVPYKSATEAAYPLTQPYWTDFNSVAFGTDDMTIEGWVYADSGVAFTFCSNHSYARQAGKWYRWGGLTLAMNSAGYVSLYIGHTRAQALILKDNHPFRGNALVIRWGSAPNTTLSGWVHLALSRKDGVWCAFIDGDTPAWKLIQSPGQDETVPVVATPDEDFLLGAALRTYDDDKKLAAYSTPVYLDSIRFIQGEGIYTSPFTVPAAAF